MISGKTLPKDVTDKWPEVLSGIKIKEMPLKYLSSVLVNFKDDKVWEIRITAETRNGGWKRFDNNMAELFNTYKHRIESVEFELNTAQLKRDIQTQTTKFLKKQKL